MRTWMHYCFILLLISSLLAGCASTQTGTDTQGAKDSKPHAGKTLHMALANHNWGEQVKKLLPAFEEQTGIKVEVESYPENELMKKLTVQLTARADFNDFSKAAQAAVTIDNHITGIPIITAQEILYYRKDLLEKAGIPVPKTLDELMEAAKKIHEPKNEIFGFVARGHRASLVTMVSSFLFSEGGDFIKNGKAAINTPEALEMAAQLNINMTSYGL